MKKLRVGTLFSGIGAFEQALKQMKIPHEIVFAGDNGERYLTQTRRMRFTQAPENLV